VSTTLSSEVAQSPVQLYMQRREAGATHERAAAVAARAYGRRPLDLEVKLEKARREFDQAREEIPLGEVGLTQRPSALELPVHPDPRQLAEPDRDLLLDPLPPATQARNVLQRGRPRRADARVHRDLQPNRQTLQVDLHRQGPRGITNDFTNEPPGRSVHTDLRDSSHADLLELVKYLVGAGCEGQVGC
jgi:hypothetical protein